MKKAAHYAEISVDRVFCAADGNAVGIAVKHA